MLGGGLFAGRPRLLRRLLFGPVSRALPILAAPRRIRTRQLGPFIDQSANTGEGGFTEGGTGKREGAKTPHFAGETPAGSAKPRKEKGGAMNAPPLKGSDTSVSSPKRQTAEAVRLRGSRKRRVESSAILRGCYQHPARIGCLTLLPEAFAARISRNRVNRRRGMARTCR
jgi:hypothetical protein